MSTSRAEVSWSIGMDQRAGGESSEDRGDCRKACRMLMDELEKEGKKGGKVMCVMILPAVVVFCGMFVALAWSLTPDGRKKHPVLSFYLALLMMLTFGLWITQFLTLLVSWPFKRYLRFHRYAVYLIEGLKGSVDVTFFLCLVLVSADMWILPRVNIWIIPDSQVFRFLVALCLGSFLSLIKNILYYMLEAQVLYLRLFERIRVSVTFLHAVNLLNQQPVSAIGKSWLPILKMERGSVPIWILRLLADDYMVAIKRHPQLFDQLDLIIRDDFKLIDEAELRYNEITRRHRQNSEDLRNLPDPGITRDHMRQFRLKDEELNYIFLRPQHKYLRTNTGGRPQTDLTDQTNVDKNISFHRFLNLMVKGCKICRYLENNLKGSIKMFVKLNRVLNAFVFLVVLIIWLLLSQLVSVGQIALLFGPFVAASFIFGESLKNMFQGLIFVFGMHPFDVGDRVTIDDVQMRVTDLEILTSIFMKYGSEEEVVIPNTTLLTTKIINAGEEVIIPNLRDSVEFLIDGRTSIAGIQYLKANILTFMDNTAGHYQPKVTRAAFGNEYITMKVSFDYKNRRLSAEEKEEHKSIMLSIITRLVKEMEMKMQERQPSYTIEISLDPRCKLRMEDIEDAEAEIISSSSENEGSINVIAIMPSRGRRGREEILQNVASLCKTLLGIEEMENQQSLLILKAGIENPLPSTTYLQSRLSNFHVIINS